MKSFHEGKIVLAGHRGERTLVPENTMAAFRYALSCGADAIETDFHLTKDGRLVIMHDHTIDRTTDGEGRVCDYTFEELRTFSAGRWFSEEFAAERIPAAEEFFELTAKEELLFNLELKVYPFDEGERRAREAADKLIDMLDAFGIAGERVVINSWSLAMLAYVRERCGSRFLLQGYYPLANFKDGAAGDPFEIMDYACLFPLSGRDHVCPRSDYEALLAHGVVPCNNVPAVYTDVARAYEYGSRMFTADDLKTTECILRSLGAR